MSVPKVKTHRAGPRMGDMVQRAVGTLHERGGSSAPAIKKYIGETFKNLPLGWEKLVHASLKRLKTKGTLVMVKSSYKLHKPGHKVKKAAPKAPPAAGAAEPKKAAAPAKKSASPDKKATPVKKAPAVKNVATKKAAPAQKTPMKKKATAKKA